MLKKSLLALGCASGVLLSASSLAETQHISILGGQLNGGVDPDNPVVDPNSEASIDGGISWGPAYLAGGHPWGYVSDTNSWVNWQIRRSDDNRWWLGSDPSASDANPFVSHYRIRFSAPGDWTNGSAMFDFVLKADNKATIFINGQEAGYVIGSSIYNSVDFSFEDNLLPGINEIYLIVEDWGGLDGFNYRIDMELDAETGFNILPPASSPESTVDTDGDGFADFEEDLLGTDSSVADCVDLGNHGKYVSCVSHMLNYLVEIGLITDEEKDARQSIAAQSDIGKPKKQNTHPGKKGK